MDQAESLWIKTNIYKTCNYYIKVYIKYLIKKNPQQVNVEG